MLLYTMLYIVLAYLMLFAALTNSVCLNNASFFFLFKYFLCQGYELSGEIALKNNHYYYYYYYYYYMGNCVRLKKRSDTETVPLRKHGCETFKFHKCSVVIFNTTVLTLRA